MFRQQRQAPRQRHRRDGATGTEQQRWHKANERFDLPFDVGRAHRPPQQPGDHHALAHECGQHHQHHPPVERLTLHRQRHHAQQHPLHGHGADKRRQPAAAQREQIQSHRQPDQEIQHSAHFAPPFHATSNANRHSRNAVVSNSGTRRNATRPSSVSPSPPPPAPPRPPAANAPAAASGDNSPIGSTAWISSTAN